jgi:quercetin dioxygenase-like cupin family protein
MIRRSSILVPALAAAALLAASATLAQDPLKVAPDRYRSLLENERVRVMEVVIKPGEKVATHSHPDHLGYVLAGEKLTITGADGKAMEHSLKPGDVLWIKAETHSGVNSGKTDVRVLVVELKEPAPKKM